VFMVGADRDEQAVGRGDASPMTTADALLA
jgi:hypothetical protein